MPAILTYPDYCAAVVQRQIAFAPLTHREKLPPGVVPLCDLRAIAATVARYDSDLAAYREGGDQLGIHQEYPERRPR